MPAAAAMRKKALIPAQDNPNGDIDHYYTGETQVQYAERQFISGYAANPVIKLMFPDAFTDVVDFVRTFKDSRHDDGDGLL